MNHVRNNLLFFLSLIVIALMTYFVTSAQAAPARPSATSGGLFAGTFTGVLTGDDDSQAPVTLELTQDGRVVSGEITVGRGLLIDAGRCGQVTIPTTTQTASGTTTAQLPRHLTAAAAFEVQGIPVGIDLEADLARDGETLDATATIDLPWLCGRDPQIVGELTKSMPDDRS